MSHVGVLKSDDKRSKLGQRQPRRHLPLEHAALALVGTGAAPFAGDDKREARPVSLRAGQKAQELGMRRSQSEPMQIEPRIDLLTSARDPRPKPPAERRERWLRLAFLFALLLAFFLVLLPAFLVTRRRGLLSSRLGALANLRCRLIVGSRFGLRSATAQRFNRARETAPQRAFLFAQ